MESEKFKITTTFHDPFVVNIIDLSIHFFTALQKKILVTSMSEPTEEADIVSASGDEYADEQERQETVRSDGSDEEVIEDGDEQKEEEEEDDIELDIDVDDELPLAQEEVEVALSAELEREDPDQPFEKVKRPSSAWMIYMNQNRQRLKSEQPDLSIGEVAKALSAEYKNLSQDLLDVYLDLARKDKERYVEAMAKQRISGKVPGGSGGGASFAPIAPGETIFPLVRSCI